MEFTGNFVFPSGLRGEEDEKGLLFEGFNKIIHKDLLLVKWFYPAIETNYKTSFLN
jgi:hypothetical protein